MFLVAVAVVCFYFVSVHPSSAENPPDWTGARLPPFFPNGKDRPIPKYSPSFSRHTPYLTEDSLPQPVYGRYGAERQHGFNGGSDSGPPPRSIPEKREFAEPFSGPQSEIERPSEFLAPRFGASGRVPSPEYFVDKESVPRRGEGDRIGFPELGKPYYPEYFRPDNSEGPPEGSYRPRINPENPNLSEKIPRQQYSESSETDDGPPRQRYNQRFPEEGSRGFRPPVEEYRPRYSEDETFRDDRRRPPQPSSEYGSPEQRGHSFRGPESGNIPRNPVVDEHPPIPQGPFDRSNTSTTPSHPPPSRSTPSHGGDIELPGDKSRPERLFAIRPPEFPAIPAPPPYPSLSPMIVPATPPPLPGSYHFGTTAATVDTKLLERSGQNVTEQVDPKKVPSAIDVPVYSPLSGPFPAPKASEIEATSVPSIVPQGSRQQEGERPSTENKNESVEPPKQKPQGLPSSFRSFFPPGFGPFEKGSDENSKKE